MSPHFGGETRVQMTDNAHIDPIELAALEEATAEHLIKKGNELLKLGQKLLYQAGSLAALNEQEVPVERRSVGTKGIVMEPDVIRAARSLGTFDRQQLGEELGLKGPALVKWLGVLIERPNPIVERRADGTFAYLPPPTGMTEHPSQPAPESLVVDPMAQASRGIPQRVSAAQKAARAGKGGLSRPGEGHRIRQQDARYERIQRNKQRP